MRENLSYTLVTPFTWTCLHVYELKWLDLAPFSFKRVQVFRRPAFCVKIARQEESRSASAAVCVP